LGLRYLMFPRKKKYNVFLSMTMNELFDIDYREEHVFDFKTGPATNFSRIFIYEAQTTGPLLGQFALGGEIRLTERFSFSFEGGYAFSIRDGKLSSFNMRNDLNDGDRIQSVPQPFGYDFRLGEVVALSPDGRNRESIKLTLDGWRVASKFSVTF
ncbi:MAG: hypothetical protein OEZ58_20030, partial [Gammaproteobacteria bacterium]|nr:hypothetical protein [Gammaproteobacteria bacterium]